MGVFSYPSVVYLYYKTTRLLPIHPSLQVNTMPVQVATPQQQATPLPPPPRTPGTARFTHGSLPRPNGPAPPRTPAIGGSTPRAPPRPNGPPPQGTPRPRPTPPPGPPPPRPSAGGRVGAPCGSSSISYSTPGPAPRPSRRTSRGLQLDSRRRLGSLPSARFNLSNDLLAEATSTSGSSQSASTVIIGGVPVKMRSTPNKTVTQQRLYKLFDKTKSKDMTPDQLIDYMDKVTKPVLARKFLLKVPPSDPEGNELLTTLSNNQQSIETLRAHLGLLDCLDGTEILSPTDCLNAPALGPERLCWRCFMTVKFNIGPGLGCQSLRHLITIV